MISITELLIYIVCALFHLKWNVLLFSLVLYMYDSDAIITGTLPWWCVKDHIHEDPY